MNPYNFISSIGETIKNSVIPDNGGIDDAMLEQIREIVSEFSESESKGRSQLENLSGTISQAVSNTNEENQEQAQALQNIQSTFQELLSQESSTGLGEFDQLLEVSASSLFTEDVISGLEQGVIDPSLAEEYLAFIEEIKIAQQDLVSGSIDINEFTGRISTKQKEITRNLQQNSEIQTGIKNAAIEQVSIIGDNLFGSYEDVNEIAEETGTSLSDVKETAEQVGAADIAEPFIGGLASINEMKTGLLALATNPMVLLATAAGAVLTTFMNLNNRTQDLMDNTGLARDRARELSNEIQQSSGKFARLGSGADEVQEGVVALIGEFGNLNQAAFVLNTTTSDIQTEIATFSEALNMSGTEAAEMIRQFETISRSTGQARQEIGDAASNAANITEVPLQSVMNGLAENSERLARNTNMTGEEMAVATARARKMGIEISDMLDLQENFVEDMPGKLSAIANAEVMTGLSFDTQEISMAAAEGDIGAMQDSIMETLEGVDLQNMGVHEVQALEEALGMSHSQLVEMQKGAEQLTQTHEEMVASVASGNMTFMEGLDAQNLTPFNKKLDELEASGLELMNSLIPLGEDLMDLFIFLSPIIEKVIGGIEKLAGAISYTFEMVSSLYSEIGKLSSTVVDSLGPLGPILSEVFSIFTENIVEDKVMGAGAGFMSFENTIAGFMGIGLAAYFGTKLYGAFQKVRSGVSNLISGQFKLSNIFGSTVGKADEMTEATSKLSSTTSKSGNIISRFIDQIGEIADSISEAVPKIGGIFTSIFDTLKDVLGSVLDFIGSTLNKIISIVSEGLEALLRGLGQAVVAFAQPLKALINPAVIGGLAVFTAGAIGLGVALRLMAPALEAVAQGFVGIFETMQPTFKLLGSGIVSVLEGIGYAFARFGDALVVVAENAGTIITSMFEGLVRVGESAAGIAAAASSTLLLAGAMTALTANSIVGGITSIFGADSFVDQLTAVANLAEPLEIVALSIDMLADSLERLQSVGNVNALSNISDITFDVSGNAESVRTNDTVTSVTNRNIEEERSVRSITDETISTTNEDTESSTNLKTLINELISQQKDVIKTLNNRPIQIELMIDGRTVTTTLVRANQTNALERGNS